MYDRNLVDITKIRILMVLILHLNCLLHIPYNYKHYFKLPSTKKYGFSFEDFHFHAFFLHISIFQSQYITIAF